MIIRPETIDDADGIRLLTELAFRDKPYAEGDEQDVIDRLRKGDALTLSLVAEENGVLSGQITFSPATNSDGSYPWFALGPVSVLPTHQGQGIGSALINSGLDAISKIGALGCILTGNPLYYIRFGFKLSPQNAPPNEPAEYFMLKLLKAQQPEGAFTFHRAFYGDV